MRRGRMKPGPRRCVLPGVVKRHRNDQEKAEEHAQELLEPPGGAELLPAGQPPLATPRRPTPA